MLSKTQKGPNYCVTGIVYWWGTFGQKACIAARIWWTESNGASPCRPGERPFYSRDSRGLHARTHVYTRTRAHTLYTATLQLAWNELKGRIRVTSPSNCLWLLSSGESSLYIAACNITYVLSAQHIPVYGGEVGHPLGQQQGRNEPCDIQIYNTFDKECSPEA